MPLFSMNVTHHCNIDQSLWHTGLCKQYHHHSLLCIRIEFLRIDWCKRGSNLEPLIQLHICLRKTDPVTYKHSVSGSKSAGKHVTKVRIGIRSENLILKIFIWDRAILLERHMGYSHGPPCRNALYSLRNSVIITCHDVLPISTTPSIMYTVYCITYTKSVRK